MQLALLMIASSTRGTGAAVVFKAHPVQVSTGEAKDPEVSTVTKAACCLGKWVRGIYYKFTCSVYRHS